jgi:predicted membrane channel-forming protein YqfA (hemolysin III family)
MKTKNINELPQLWLVYPYTTDEYRVNYTWKMAIKSILFVGHNEIWMIWTEIIPLSVFIWMFYELAHTDKYSAMNSFKRVLCNIMYSAAICCRACSLFYHTFNCVSLKMNTALINVDLIGIATNALGVPWISYLYFETHTVENVYIEMIICSYFFFFTWMYINNNLFHIRCFLKSIYIANDNLLYLAIVGNVPTNMVIIYASSLSDYGRIFLLGGELFLLCGFILFYKLKLPESIIGYRKIVNSHIFWHIFTFFGQYCFLMTAFY